MCLSVLAFANAVRTSLGQQQRLVAGDVLQSHQVGAQVLFAVQIR